MRRILYLAVVSVLALCVTAQYGQDYGYGGGFRAFQAPIVPAQLPIPLLQSQIPQGQPQFPQQQQVQEEFETATTPPPPPPNQPEFVEQPQFVQPQPQFVQPPPPQFAAAQPQFAAPAPAAPAAASSWQWYSPYYYQGQAAGGYYCFTADTEVEHMDGRMIRMDELKKNDIIKTLNGKRIGYSPVSFWLHRVPTQEAEFVKISLENGKEVKLTGKHYIYASKCGTQDEQVQLPSGPIFADMVKEGDCLFSVDEADITQSRVSKIALVRETGIYAPMTSNGKLIVNGIYASCHNVVQHHEVQRTFFDYLTSAGDAVKECFGAEDVNEIPYGMGLLVQMMEFALPKAGF